MRVFIEPIAIEGGYRVQPWERSEIDPRAMYYDFKAQPELITRMLEDYTPFSHYDSVQQFYVLLKWLNGSGSPFETNDARMSNIAKNGDLHLANKEQVRIGVLMFFFRNLLLNLSEESTVWFEKYQKYEVNADELAMRPSRSLVWLINLFAKKLEEINPKSQTDCIGLSLAPVIYLQAPVREDQKFGHEIIVRYWLWGNNDDEIFATFSSTVSAMEQSFKALAIQVNRRKQLRKS